MLKALMLKRSLDGKRNELVELEKAAEQFATREAELEAAIAEVEPGNTEQEQGVNAEIEKFEADKAAHDEQVETLRAGIAALETELEELERSAPKPTPAEPKTEPDKRGAIMQNTINLRSLPCPPSREALSLRSLTLRTSWPASVTCAVRPAP